MASRLRPEIVARLEPTTVQAVPATTGAAPSAVGPTAEVAPEQLEALEALVDGLMKDKDAELAERLLGDGDSVVIRLRRADPGEAWVRVR